MFINAIFYKTSSALGFKALAPHVQTWRLGRSGCSRCGCWSRINNCWRCRSSLNRGRGGFCSLALAISKTPDGTLWMTRPLTFDQSLAPLSSQARATVVRYVNTVISWLNICFTFFKIVACLNQIIAFTEFNLKIKIYIILKYSQIHETSLILLYIPAGFWTSYLRFNFIAICNRTMLSIIDATFFAKSATFWTHKPPYWCWAVAPRCRAKSFIFILAIYFVTIPK